MLKLTVEFGGKILNAYHTDGKEVLIGRNSDNDIQIDNLAVSGRHARIFKKKDGYVIEDLGSTNGTFVDGKKITQRTIHENERITIGKHNLFLHTTGGKSKVPDFIETMKMDIKTP